MNINCSENAYHEMAVICDDEREFWLARDLLQFFMLSWDEFYSFIMNIEEVCKKEKKCLMRHNFIYFSRLCVIDGAETEIPDYKLSCYACYKLMELLAEKYENAVIGRDYFYKRVFGE